MTFSRRALRLSFFPMLLLLQLGCTGTPSDSSEDADSALSVVSSAVADATVDSAQAHTAMGKGQTLEADTSPSVKRALLQFKVTNLPGNSQVSSARLQLHVVDKSNLGATVSTVNGTWSESTVTFASAPAVGNKVAQFPASPSVGQWASTDVHAVVNGNGTFSFYLTTTSADGVDFSSRESAYAPKLILTYSTVKAADGGTKTGGGTDAGTTPPPPVAVGGTQLGYYEGAFADDTGKSSFGRYPDIASTYYQGNSTTGVNLAQEEARISHGTSPLITVTLKDGPYTWAQMGNGDSGAEAYMDKWVASLKTLSEYGQSHGNVAVRFTADHEFEVKLNQGAFQGTPPTTAEYAKGLSRFLTKVKAGAPLVLRGYWFGYSDTTKINAVGSALDMSLVQWISLDPYSWSRDSASEGFEATVSPHVTWLRSQSWYKGQPVGLSEFGSELSHGDASLAAFMTDLRTHMGNLGLTFACFFDRPGTDDWNIDDGSHPQAVAAFSKSLAAE